MSQNQKARKLRRLIVYSSTAFLIASTFIFLLWSLRPMLLPFILGVFIAYLFKPVVNSFKGSNLSKYFRAAVLLTLIVTAIYWTTQFIQSSLPNEKEQLELLVRLQFRLNDRYIKVMGIDKKTGKGNI